MFITITDDMKERAKEEAKKRNPYIKHHFNVTHVSSEDRDIIGFLGEFACCKYLGLDWRNNIRANYLTVDDGDVQFGGTICDVKTETLPADYLNRICNKTIRDDETWGRRLINEHQVNLLKKYKYVIFGGFVRNSGNKEWYPFGYLETEYILANYQVTNVRPDGGTYLSAALPVKTSELKPLSDLKAKFLKNI